MRPQLISSLLCSLAALATCAPTAEPAPVAETNKLAKRDMCTLHGWYEVEIVVGSGGPGQGPVSFNYMGWRLEYVGGVQISSIDGDSIAIGGTTLKPAQTKLPNDLVWHPDFSLGFRGCQVDYEGHTYKNDPVISRVPQAGTIYWECKVDFQCEGNR